MPSNEISSSLRAIPTDFDADAVSEIDRRLDVISGENDVRILWAIESGSRAWGFPSPDSDYDARFIYVRTVEKYVGPWHPRDVIEMPIEDDMDVNGWDLGKAIKLMLKGNAVVLEWLQSSIVYQGDPAFQRQMVELAEHCTERPHFIRHYFHLGSKQWERFLNYGTDAPIKKLFYAARPALCLRWLRLDDQRKIPPMNFQALLEGAETPPTVFAHLSEMAATKAKTREMGNAPISAEIGAFIQNEYDLAQTALSGSEHGQSNDHIKRASKLFYDTALRYSKR